MGAQVITEIEYLSIALSMGQSVLECLRYPLPATRCLHPHIPQKIDS
ncbi:MAG: hypothetical protein JWP47_1497 [Polaromonas sp.]|nr:hypothetical protein [Polaromonas sp.]